MTDRNYDINDVAHDRIPALAETVAGLDDFMAVFTEDVVQNALDTLIAADPTIKVPRKVQDKAIEAGPQGGIYVWAWAVNEFIALARRNGDERTARAMSAEFRIVSQLLHNLVQSARDLWPPEPPTWVTQVRATRYGITVDDGLRMLEEQGHACAICCVPFTSPRAVRFDHNHATGAFRGFLCQPCNTGIGLLRDNPRIAAAAAKYLTDRGHYGTDNEENL